MQHRTKAGLAFYFYGRWELGGLPAHSGSIGGAATREVKDGAGGKRAFLGTQPADHRRYFVGGAKAAHGNLAQHVGDVFGLHLLKNRGLHGCGRDAVHADAGLRQFLAQ